MRLILLALLAIVSLSLPVLPGAALARSQEDSKMKEQEEGREPGLYVNDPLLELELQNLRQMLNAQQSAIEALEQRVKALEGGSR
tara:strand:+ start:6936 stop:7190 length:255 start_codon:yes stop_codon:yes gene_type:complete